MCNINNQITLILKCLNLFIRRNVEGTNAHYDLEFLKGYKRQTCSLHLNAKFFDWEWIMNLEIEKNDSGDK